MCSQSSAECTRRRSGRFRRVRAFGADGSSAGGGVSSSLLTTAILDTRPPDLLIAREVRGHRLRGEAQVLLDELIAAVLARRLDHDAVRPLLHDGAAVVAPVPHHAVCAGWARRAGHAGDEIGATRVLHLTLAAEPAPQLTDVAWAATVGVHPEAERANALPLRRLHPHGDVRAVIAVAFLRRDLEVDGELEALVPRRRSECRPPEAPDGVEPGNRECDAGQPSEHAAAAEEGVVTHIVHRWIP